ncbi:amidase [Robbsia andropogonis]|uniref:amidase n=1 Tax=Robbsia andropogonis TaxID=28092 RepID=UPI0020A1ADFB|nr:amidase [Robbsia andropogonis]MCP1116859.1 amidase [Robbsia andropogonis]MCP1126462.1 amidase [Robbsia andropogonis]
MNELVSTFTLAPAAPNGLSIVVKDTIDIAGMRTVAGSRALAEVAPATRHADVVTRLLDRGWTITGKANMHELAFGMTGINAFTGTATNPQDPARVPGGSSSGSAAAVGAGLANASLGTDTGGSIRGPAACCGVIGLKPTFGRVSRVGVAPDYTTLDCVGPFARDMDIIERVMQALTDDFDMESTQRADGRYRLAVLQPPCDPTIAQGVANAIAATGLDTLSVMLPDMPDAFDAGLTIINTETAQAFGHLTNRGLLQADLEARLDNAKKTTEDAIARAEAVRSRFTQAVDAILDQADVLVMPTMPELPITVAQALAGVSVINVSALIRPFNLSGHPALSLPVPLPGLTIKGGLQIIGRHGADEMVCAVARVFESALKTP